MGLYQKTVKRRGDLRQSVLHRNCSNIPKLTSKKSEETKIVSKDFYLCQNLIAVIDFHLYLYSLDLCKRDSNRNRLSLMNRLS